MKKLINLFWLLLPNVYTIVSYYNDTKDFKTAFIKTIPIFIITLFIASIMVIINLSQDKKHLEKEKESLLQDIQRLEQEKKEIQKRVDETKARHEALSHQYTMKKKKLENMEKYWLMLNTVFLTALQSSKKERFEEAHSTYLRLTQYINNEEE